MLFSPAFTSEKGSGNTLSVKNVNIIKSGNSYYGLDGQPFNPENPSFSSVYVLTTQSGVVYEIDAVSGDLLTVTDGNGNKLTYTDGGIFSSSGKSVLFGRDLNGRIVQVTDPLGNVVRYGYDSLGDLVSVTDREGNSSRFEYNSGRVHYLDRVIDGLNRVGVRSEYDELGRLKRLFDVNGNPVEMVYQPGNSIQRVKDVFGKETIYEYDSRGNVLTEIEPLGKVIKRTYDENNNLLSETIITSETGSLGYKTEYTYDSNGNKITEKDPLGNITRYTYGDYGRLLTETDGLGNTTTYTYSRSGNLLSSKDAVGNITKYSYDLKGNLTSLTDAGNNVTQFSYDAFGNVTSLNDANGNSATYLYDSNGNMQRETMKVMTPEGEKQFLTEWIYNKEGKIKSVTQSGVTTNYEYDSNGNQTAIISNNRRTEYRYDKESKLIETIYPDTTPNTNTDNPRTITLYDKGGMTRATIDKNGKITHYNYDALGRLTETIYPDETTNQIPQLIAAIAPNQTPTSIDWTNIVYPDTTPSYLVNHSRSKTEYYQTGQIKTEIDIFGNRTNYEYDAANRVSLTRFDANTYVTYAYDAVGNRIKETYNAYGTSISTAYDSLGRVTANTNQNGNTTQFQYDTKGRLLAAVDAQKQRTEYSYDSNGNLTSIKDANGRITGYEYDNKGRRTALVRPDLQRSTIAYNDTNYTTTLTDFNNKTVKYTYDSQNRLISQQFVNQSGGNTSITYTRNGLSETITDSRGATVYNYNQQNQLISRKDPTGPYLASGNSLEYEYNSTGNITKVKTPTRTTTYTYDNFGRLETVSTPDMGTVKYRYDDKGNLYQTELPNHIVETRIYDNLGRLDILKTVKVNPTTKQEIEVISSYDYGFDNLGNRTEILENNGRITKYKYDSLNRLVEEAISFDPNGNNRFATYSYDKVGNRLKKTDSVAGDTTYAYNNLNQLISSTGSGVTTTYTYDNNGNLISEVAGTNSTTYRWVNDGENRLMGTTVIDGLETRNIEYKYNANGMRVSQVVNGVETRYLIDELSPYDQVVEEYDGQGNAKASYVYGYDLIGQVSGSQKSFYHVDGLGSTRVLTNGLGQVSDSYVYDGFGNVISRSGSGNNGYQFAGEWRDKETGLDYLRARYYDPFVGRFISGDAYEGSLDDPMSLHDYLYGHANPVMNTDPSGYFTLGEVSAGIAISGILAGLSFTTGGALGVLAGGGSVHDALSLYDQYLAGFGDGASGGLSTKFREQRYGATATRDHRGAFFNLGRLTGVVSVMGLGWAAPNSLASVTWGQRVAQLHTVFSTGIGSYQSSREILENRSTPWDWLVFLPLITHAGSVFWRDLAQRSSQIQSNVNIYDEAGSLRILAVEELDSGAKQLRREFLNSRWTLAVGRVLNPDDSVTMVVSTNGDGSLGRQLRQLVTRSNWEASPRMGSDIPHAETRMIRWAEQNGYKLEAIGVSHGGGICLSCYADMLLRGIYPASPFNSTFPLERVEDLLNSLDNWTQTNENAFEQ